MKKVSHMTWVMLVAILNVHAQLEIPQGIRYQAIARDNKGIIRSNESLIAKVELISFFPAQEVTYTELHNVTSNPFGLINITIGEGINTIGSFAEIPWSEYNLWVRVSIKENEDEDYQVITESKFYSVPYAFYAATAGQLAEKTGYDDTGIVPSTYARGVTNGMNSINWTLEGNYNAQNRNNGNPVLGTTDYNPLVLITNGIPRLIISADGGINLTTDLDNEGDLNVKQNVNLNTSGGTTVIHGPMTVEDMSPTHLTGTLTVDKATTLNNSLTVANMAATQLTGTLDVDKTLTVDGATTLNNSLTVANMAATNLTGTLNVDKATTLNNSLTVANMAATQLTGTLDVDKSLTVDGATTLNNALTVANMAATNLTGTLTVDKATTLNNSLTVANMAATQLTGTLDVDKTLTVDGVTTLNNSLTVANMAATNLTGTLTVDKLTTLQAGLTLTGTGTLGPNNDHLVFFDNTEGSSSDGIGIRIQNTSTTKENNFVTFYRGDNGVAGRIEGYVLNDIGSPPIPTSDEIWTILCIGIADYNPVTLVWTQFAQYFNLFGTVWNGATIPSFEIPDFPGLTLPDFPGLTLPDYPGLVLPDFPGLGLPDFPGVSIPDVPSVSIDGVGTVFPGLTLPDVPSLTIPDIPAFVVPDIPAFGIPDIPAFTIPDIPPFTIPDVPEINLAEDLFEIPTIPTFSDILMDLDVCPDEDVFAVPGGYVYRLIEWGVQYDMQNMISFSPIDLAAKVAAWGVTRVVKAGGVTYGAKGADYAEYLPKLNPNDKFLHGELIGIYGGKISRKTEGADQILAVSTYPVVLGNLPDESDIDAYEKVGFLGQVPVFVKGPVEVGDYIIPSGKNDGIGKAIRPGEIRAELLPMILGKAWSSSRLNSIAVINVSIGLRPTEIGEVLKQREEILWKLQEQINTQNAIHDKLKAEVDLLKEHLGIANYSSSDGSK